MPLHTAAVRALPCRSQNPLFRVSRLSPRPRLQNPVRSPVARRLYSQQQQQQQKHDGFFSKLREALKNTKTEWYAIPVGLGLGVVAFTQIRKNVGSSPAEQDVGTTATTSGEERPAGEKKIRPMRSWYELDFAAPSIPAC